MNCLFKLLRFARPYRTRLVLGILFGFLAGLGNAMMLGSVKLTVDTVFPSGAPSTPAASLTKVPTFLKPAAEWVLAKQRAVMEHRSQVAILLIISTIPLSMLLRGLFMYLNTYLTNWVSIRVISDIRSRLFTHLLGLPASFFSRISTGELMSRFTEACYIQSMVGSSLVTIILEPISILSLLAFLLSQQPKLTLIALSTLPLALIPFVVYSRKWRKSCQGMYQQLGDMGKLMHETFSSYRVVKAYNLEDRMAEEYRLSAKAGVSFYMRAMRAAEISSPLMELIAGIGVAIFFIYLAFLAPARTVGDMITFVGGIFAMYAPIKNLLRLRTQLDQAAIASQALFEMMETKSDILDPVHPKPLRAAGAPIHFDHVSFAYTGKPVLNGIELTVPPGETVALVGSSGAGKTTLANLLLRFYDPTRGAVRVGNLDIREATTRNLRDQIAVVTQETILFNDTIRKNIELGRPGASEAEIMAAAKHAHAHEFILEKPRGYDTVIGEKGITLSGGQRQRIAIARAILKNAPILILDEATSALDTESERAVQAALANLMRDRTTICIAHRLSTIQKADLIVVLDQGRIVEMGRHAELLRHNGVYRRLYELQFQS